MLFSLEIMQANLFLLDAMNYPENFFRLHVRTRQANSGNLVLRHSIPLQQHFPSNSGGIASLMAELNAALCAFSTSERTNINILFSTSMNRTHNLSSHIISSIIENTNLFFILFLIIFSEVSLSVWLHLYQFQKKIGVGGGFQFSCAEPI